jgi:hypothetical protein
MKYWLETNKIFQVKLNKESSEQNLAKFLNELNVPFDIKEREEDDEAVSEVAVPTLIDLAMVRSFSPLLTNHDLTIVIYDDGSSNVIDTDYPTLRAILESIGDKIN